MEVVNSAPLLKGKGCGSGEAGLATDVAKGSVDLAEGSKNKDEFSRHTEIRLGISHTRRLLAEIVAGLPC